MGTRAVACVFAVTLVDSFFGACGGDDAPDGGAERRGPVDPAFANYGVPGYPGAQRFDEGRVYGEGDGTEMEISHASFATGDAPEEVLAFYRQRLGAEGYEDGAWRLPAGGPTERTVGIERPGSTRPGCEPPDSAETVIAVSRIMLLPSNQTTRSPAWLRWWPRARR